MYIDIFKLGQIILILLGIILLVLLIIILFKFIKTISRVNSIITKNEINIDEVLSTLPKTIINLYDIAGNVKDVTAVVVKITTASDLKVTGPFQRYIVDIVDILTTIIKNISSNEKKTK
jgi:hypothetical protein